MIRKKTLVCFCLIILLTLTAVCFSIGRKQSQKKVICTHIAQTGPRREALSTDYLVALLEIPTGSFFSFGAFDLHQAEQRLLSHPAIEKAVLTQEEGGILLIDYTLRTPIAFLGDFSNTALDRKGYFFPFFPFFTPKKIPVFYLGLNSLPAAPLRGEKIDLALALFDALKTVFPFRFPTVVSIDVSKVSLPYLGRREAVVTLKTRAGHVHHLRLTQEHYLDELNRYCAIRGQWQGNLTFDLRIDQLALVRKNE